MNRIAAAIVAFIVWTSFTAGGGFAAGWWWKSDRAEGKEANQRAAGAEAFATQVNDARQLEHAQADSDGCERVIPTPLRAVALLCSV